jgi:nitrate/TMAO reductase-like tetraheme cytochrome c subunit
MKLPTLFSGNKKERRWPKLTIDLSLAKHRRNLFFAAVALFIVGIGLAVGGVQGYEYTESREFCGTSCHSMDPQWVRYQRSPHVNVRCADCHVGPGLAHFVQSKIDGSRQLISTITDSFSRPIKSPVKNLRPAREVCETCHTPTSFKDNIVKTILHYDNDKANTQVMTSLILKMGGVQETTGHSLGIHWHISGKVYYIAADDQRQVMLWVGVQQPDGSLKEYFARDLIGMGQTNFVEQARAEGRVREMDCVDCHNRIAHFIPSPDQSIDQLLETGVISRDIPFVRMQAVAVLTKKYPGKTEAYAAFDKLADVLKSTAGMDATTKLALTSPAMEDSIAQAIKAIKQVYDETVFPDMKLDWQTNPNNSRHTPSLGCFRCHDGNHLLADASGTNTGQVISVKCNLCHTVPIVGRGDEMLVEAPVIVGAPPTTHNDFRWTIEHRTTTDTERVQCLNCHGAGFCNNSACHNLSHPADMAFTHPEEYKKKGGQVCYTCHQDVTCTRCHPAGVLKNP